VEKNALLVLAGKHGVPDNDGDMPEPVLLPYQLYQQKTGFYKTQFQVEEIYLPFYDRARKMDQKGAAMGAETLYPQKIPPLTGVTKAVFQCPKGMACFLTKFN
jgi:hypothetical protein